MDSIKVNLYDAKEVFKFARDENHLMYGYELAKGFYNARYNDDGSQDRIDRADKWNSNAGAVQLFDKQTHKPLAWTDQTTTQKKGIFSSVSVPVYWKEQSGKKCATLEYKKNQLTSYGHSERICMIDLLDSYMQHREIDPHDIKKPSHPDNCRDKTKTDVFINIQQNAETYKAFLVGSGVTVKFWSERKPCDYKPVGGQCKDFIQNICPTGSHYGFVIAVSKGAKAEEVQKSSESLKTAYNEDILSYTDLKDAYTKSFDDYFNTYTNSLLQHNTDISYMINSFAELNIVDADSAVLSGATGDGGDDV